MNYSVIKKYDTSNGLGIRTSIFFTGCNFHCQGCFNKELWDFKSGKPFDEEAKTLLFEYLGDKHVKGLSVLGGEPLQQNFTELKDLLLSVKEKYPEKDIWMWTGYYIDELSPKQKEVVGCVDRLVDGRFEIDKKTGKTSYRGSENQTIWEVIKKNEDGGIEFVADPRFVKLNKD